jgi:hypothetical protein
MMGMGTMTPRKMMEKMVMTVREIELKVETTQTIY